MPIWVLVTISAVFGVVVMVGNAGSFRVLTQGAGPIVALVAIAGCVAIVVTGRRNGIF